MAKKKIKPIDAVAMDAAVRAEYGITDDIDVSNDQKVLFIKQQIDEMQRMLWRERVDIILSSRLMNDPSDTLAEKGRQTNNEKRHNARQIAMAITTLQNFLKQLRALDTGPKLSDPEV